jgi:hypothetical protein
MRGQLGDIANREIAVVFHFKAQATEQGQKAGRSQRRWPHQGSAL